MKDGRKNLRKDDQLRIPLKRAYPEFSKNAPKSNKVVYKTVMFDCLFNDDIYE